MLGGRKNPHIRCQQCRGYTVQTTPIQPRLQVWAPHFSQVLQDDQDTSKPTVYAGCRGGCADDPDVCKMTGVFGGCRGKSTCRAPREQAGQVLSPGGVQGGSGPNKSETYAQR